MPDPISDLRLERLQFKFHFLDFQLDAYLNTNLPHSYGTSVGRNSKFDCLGCECTEQPNEHSLKSMGKYGVHVCQIHLWTALRPTKAKLLVHVAHVNFTFPLLCVSRTSCRQVHPLELDCRIHTFLGNAHIPLLLLSHQVVGETVGIAFFFIWLIILSCLACSLYIKCSWSCLVFRSLYLPFCW